MRIRGVFTAALLGLGILAAAPAAWGIDIFSDGGGDWSNPLTWNPQLVPGSDDAVTISMGDTVTVDTGAAQASTTTVNGTLRFSRVASSTLTLSGGDMTVPLGGFLDMGTEAGVGAGPIPAGVKATLVLALGNGARRHGLIVDNGGRLSVRGADKSPRTLSLTDMPAAGAVSVNVTTTGAAGWAAGDTLVFSQTEVPSSWENQTEESVIASSGAVGGVATFALAPSLQYAHRTTNGLFHVLNLTRNVVIRSSGTNPSMDTAYILSRSQTQANFRIVQGELAHLGVVSGQQGLTLSGTASTAFLSSSTVRNGLTGVESFQASGVVLSGNIFYLNRNYGVNLGGGIGGHRIEANVFAADGDSGLAVGGGAGQGTRVEGNLFFSNGWNAAFGGNGSYVYFTDTISFSGNTVFANQARGLYFINTVGGEVSGNIFDTNPIVLQTATGTIVSDNTVSRGKLDVGGAYGILVSSNIFEGGFRGLEVTGTSSSVFFRNVVRSNTFTGLIVGPGSTDNLLAENTVYSNQIGIGMESGGNLLLRNITHSNFAGVARSGGGVNTHVEDVVGYDASGISLTNAVEVSGLGATIFKGCRLNSLNPTPYDWFDAPGRGLLSYNQEFATGTVRIVGDVAAESPLVLDEAQPLYGAAVSQPLWIRNSGNALMVTAVYDATSVTQLVTVRREGGQWRVEGSVSGPLEVFTGDQTGLVVTDPVEGPQFALDFIEDLSAQDGDQAYFALTAASPDAGMPKSLLFLDAGAGFNGGRSRLTVPPGSGLTLRGTTGTPAQMNKLGTNYYTVVNSGSLTLENARVRNVDADGIQVSGVGPVAISSTVFNLAGDNASPRSYMTARDLTSNATFYNVAFDDTPNRQPFNVAVQGSDAGLRWHFATFFGIRSGDNMDSDPNQKILWGDTADPDAPGGFAAATGSGLGRVDLSWSAPWDRENNGSTSTLKGGAFRIFYSTTLATREAAVPAQAQVAIATTATQGSAHARAEASLFPGDLYYFRLWALDEFGNASAPADTSATASGSPGDLSPPTVTPSLQGLGVRTAGAAWTQEIDLLFDKPMNAATVPGALSLRRVKDRLANDLSEDLAVGVVAVPGDVAFTVTSTAPLADNSVYELTVATTAADQLGMTLSSSTVFRFSTLMDRTVLNVATEGLGGSRVEFPPYSLPFNGYAAGAAAPAAAAMATQKLVANSGDAMRSPVGAPVALEVFNAAGAPMSLAAAVEVSLPFAVGPDGNVTGTSPPVRPKTLAVHWLDEGRNIWVRLASSVNAAAGTVAARPPHFTAFALIGHADAEVTDLHAFPSPWRESAGVPAVTFNGIGQGGRVEVFNVSGASIREVIDDDNDGLADWDVRDKDGDPVPAGVYFFRARNGEDEDTGKMVVIR